MGCEQRVPLWDEMEQCFASPEIQQRVRDMQEESAIELSKPVKQIVFEGERFDVMSVRRWREKGLQAGKTA